MDPHTRRLDQADEQPELQLVLRDRARGQCARPPHRHPARQDARRLQLHQRHALCARPAAGLRYLVAARQSRLVLRVGAALLQESGELRARRQRRARQRRTAERGGHHSAPGSARRLHRSRRGERLCAQPGLQQRRSGGFRLLPVHAQERQALERGRRLSQTRPRPAEPAYRDRRPCYGGAARGQARRRRRLCGEGRGAPGPRGRPGDPVGGRGAVAAIAGAFRHRPCGAAQVPGDRRCGMRWRASARTCATTTRRA